MRSTSSARSAYMSAIAGASLLQRDHLSVLSTMRKPSRAHASTEDRFSDYMFSALSFQDMLSAK